MSAVGVRHIWRVRVGRVRGAGWGGCSSMFLIGMVLDLGMVSLLGLKMVSEIQR